MPFRIGIRIHRFFEHAVDLFPDPVTLRLYGLHAGNRALHITVDRIDGLIDLVGQMSQCPVQIRPRAVQVVIQSGHLGIE